MGFETKAAEDLKVNTSTKVTDNFDAITESGYYRHISTDWAVGAPTNSDDLILYHEEFSDPEEVTGASVNARQVVNTSNNNYTYRRTRTGGSWRNWVLEASVDVNDGRYYRWSKLMSDSNPDSGNSERYYSMPGYSASLARIKVTESAAGITVAVNKVTSTELSITTRSLSTRGDNLQEYREQLVTNVQTTSADSDIFLFGSTENGKEAYGYVRISSTSYTPYMCQLMLGPTTSGGYYLYAKREI